MKKNFLVASIMILMVAILVSGCSLGSGVSKEVNALPYKDNEWVPSGESDSAVIFDEIVLFTENRDKPDSGTLYVQKGADAQDKVSDAVRKASYIYLYSADAVLFLDLENNLYIRKEGSDKSKLASDVFPGSIVISEDESTLAFLCTKSPQVDSQFPADLYMMKLGEEREKISSKVSLGDYALSYDGSVIAFKTNDSSLYIKKKSLNEKEKIASSVVTFSLSSKGNVVFYQKDNDGMYYKLEDASESEKVYTGKAGLTQVSYHGDTFCYLADYDMYTENPKGELYLVKPGIEPLKISSDIVQYILSPDGHRVYYKNNDNTLYTIELPQLKKTDEKSIAKFKEALKVQEKRKLGDDTTSFVTSKDGSIIAWTNTDFDLYCLEPGNEKQKLAPNVEAFSLSENAVVYLNKDKELQVINKTDSKKPFDASTKATIASDINNYATSPYCRYIVYTTTTGELYHLTAGSQPIKLSDKLNDFDFTYFINRQLYEKRLQLKDIAGTWKCQSYDSVMEIKDNQLIFIGETGRYDNEFTVLKADRKEIEVDEGVPESSRFELVNTDSLMYYYGEGFSDEFKRISREEFDKEATRIENMAKEKKELEAKKDAAESKALEILAGKVKEVKKGTSVYENHSLSSAKLGELTDTYTFRVTDYFIDDDVRIWLHVEDSFYNAYFWYIYE